MVEPCAPVQGEGACGRHELGLPDYLVNSLPGRSTQASRIVARSRTRLTWASLRSRPDRAEAHGSRPGSGETGARWVLLADVRSVGVQGVAKLVTDRAAPVYPRTRDDWTHLPTDTSGHSLAQLGARRSTTSSST